MPIPPTKTTSKTQNELIFTWEAYDYHPHERGWLWITIFSLVIFGSAAWGLRTGDWMVTLTFCTIAAVYLFTHRKGHQTHHIEIYQKGIKIDQTFFYKEQFQGYWFVYEERQAVAIINLQIADKKDAKIPLQMGECTPEILREAMKKINLQELTEKKESLVDLWVRVLKL